jgi:hypothetical protein
MSDMGIFATLNDRAASFGPLGLSRSGRFHHSIHRTILYFQLLTYWKQACTGKSGAKMVSESRVNAIRKLAVAGEHAGFSLEQMIQLLNSGMSAVALLDLIDWRLDPARRSSSQPVIPTGWSRVVRQYSRSQSD